MSHPNPGALVEHALAIVSAGNSGADALMAQVDQAAADLIGHRLFTIMVVHHDTLEVERRYSNQPDAYPIAGRKKKRDTWWGKHVVEEAQPFIGHGPADLQLAFADHGLIRSLGLGCVLNMPISYNGQCVGTMNLLNAGEADVYKPEHLPTARLLGALLLPALLQP